MKKNVIEKFYREIERQCNFVNIAVNELENGLSQRNQIIIWYAIQNFLVAVGDISKIFWPKFKYKRRGKILRKNLEIKNNSPINKRKFRNFFEHFDEKLEKWASSSKRHNFVDTNLGPPNMISGIDSEDIFRNFDPSTWTLSFSKDKYEIRPIIETINELYEKVLEASGS